MENDLNKSISGRFSEWLFSYPHPCPAAPSRILQLRLCLVIDEDLFWTQHEMIRWTYGRTRINGTYNRTLHGLANAGKGAEALLAGQV